MKNFFVFALTMLMVSISYGQLKTKAKCDLFVLDVLDGKINDVHADFTTGQIKAKLPCFTSDSSQKSCGEVISYKDQDLKFFPDRAYVEVGSGFKGKSTIPLLGGKRGSFFKVLGLPKLKDTDWDAYQTQYGCLILYYNATSKVKMIRFSARTTDEINICE